MIIYNDVVIITPPKCGSTSLHERLCVEDCGVYVIGPQLERIHDYDKHTTFIPWHGQGKERILMVRNPYTRARSLWLHYKREGGTLDFDGWAMHILRQDQFCVSISYFIRGVEIDNYVKLEHANGYFQTRFGIELPTLNKLSDSEIESTKETDEIIKEWAADDFKNFGY